MEICKHVPLHGFSIWSPRYHDKTVLLAVRKVGEHNKVVFTKADSMGTSPYFISGKIAKRGKKVSNGTIDCYAVKLDDLQPLEYKEKCEHEY